MLPSLLEICIHDLASALPLYPPPTPDTLPDESLNQRIYEAYTRLDAARRRLRQYNPLRHLAALRQFAALWQPDVLLVTAPARPGQPSMAICDELQAFGASLAHLELTSATACWLSGLQGLNHLTCLSLRNCPNLTPAALQHALQCLTQLSSLDLCGLAGCTDALAPTLVQLKQLVVLQLSHTSCSDITLEWLTYGLRQQQWMSQQQQQQQQLKHVAGAPMGSEASGAVAEGQWPSAELHDTMCAVTAQVVHDHHYLTLNVLHDVRSKVRSWHLAYTRVTPRAVELLSSCPDILLLDLRGSGVTARQLAPLRAKYALSAVQGAVLSRTAAMALAAVTLGQFVCTEAARHAAGVAAIRVGSAAGQQAAGGGVHDPGNSQLWVNQGAAALLQAAAEVAAGQLGAY